MSQWTETPPKYAGMYWFRWLGHEVSHPEAVRVLRHPSTGILFAVTGNWKPTKVDDMPGDWWPDEIPIPVPDTDGDRQ